MTPDDKLDRLLEDVAVIRTVVSQHTKELVDLQSQLNPIFAHVSGMRILFKIGGAVIGILTCLAGLLLLLK